MMSEFDGRMIVLTGGAGGIGMACAKRFLAEGARVHLVDIDGELLAKARADLAAGNRLTTHRSDLASPQACAAALDAADGKIRSLVHLAGVFEVDALEPEHRGAWDRAIQGNLTNAYDVTAAFKTRHVRDEPAQLVFASSLAFRRGSFDHVGYSAAKGGIVGLTRALARAFAPHVNVNAVAPGVIETRMPAPIIATRREKLMAEIPMKRFGAASEVASVIRFLCSSDASYVTGQTINIDGGTIHG
jgi:3-oxoacyl-[acyl-carrier protein] reductase